MDEREILASEERRELKGKLERQTGSTTFLQKLGKKEAGFLRRFYTPF